MSSSSEKLRQIYLDDALSVEKPDDIRVTVSEATLVNDNWVHLLASHIRGEKDIPIYLWVRNVAGKPFNPVDVVDGNQKVLFTIPALLDKNKEVYSEEISSNISDTVTDINNKNKVIPNSGNHVLVRELIDTVAPPKSATSYLKNWLPFIEHFDIKIEGLDKEVLKPESARMVKISRSYEDIDDSF